MRVVFACIIASDTRFDNSFTSFILGSLVHLYLVLAPSYMSSFTFRVRSISVYIFHIFLENIHSTVLIDPSFIPEDRYAYRSNLDIESMNIAIYEHYGCSWKVLYKAILEGYFLYSIFSHRKLACDFRACF